ARERGPQRRGDATWSRCEEVRIRVRAVDAHVAARAVAVRGLDVARGRDGVTLVAQQRHRLPREEMAVRAAVRLVAARAALAHDAGGLEHERPRDVVAALAAAAIVRLAEAPEVRGAVRLVAVEARGGRRAGAVPLRKRER